MLSTASLRYFSGVLYTDIKTDMRGVFVVSVVAIFLVLFVGYKHNARIKAGGCSKTTLN